MLKASATVYYNPSRFFITMALWCYGLITAQDFFPIFLTFPIFIIVLYKISTIHAKYFTVDDMLWLCCLLFFVVAPCQSINNYAFTSTTNIGVHYEVSDFLIAEMIVFLSFLFFIMASSSKKDKNTINNTLADTFRISSSQLVITFAVAIIGFVGFVAFYGMSNILASRFEKDYSDSSFVSILFLAFLTVGTTIFAIASGKNPQGKRGGVFVNIFFLFLAALLMLSVNPLNMPRFFNVATWVPVILAYLGIRFSYIYPYLGIMLGIFVIMPIASITSRFGLAGLDAFTDSNYARDAFLLKDMDVFNTLVHGVKFMSFRDYYWGDNILCVLFFFVPRSIWEDKPIMGALLVGDDLYTRYSAGTANLSYFFGGDLYMDFGLIGVMLGFAVVGWLYKRSQSSASVVYSGRNLVTLVMIGSIPILIRGPLGAVEGYFVCLIASVYVYSLVYRSRWNMR